MHIKALCFYISPMFSIFDITIYLFYIIYIYLYCVCNMTMNYYSYIYFQNFWLLTFNQISPSIMKDNSAV